MKDNSVPPAIYAIKIPTGILSQQRRSLKAARRWFMPSSTYTPTPPYQTAPAIPLAVSHPGTSPKSKTAPVSHPTRWMVPCFASRYNSCKAFHLPQPESEVQVPRKAKHAMGRAKSEAITTSAIRSGETSSHVFPQFPSPVCVHKVSQVGAEQARIELQVVILE